jgi:hypothetical protein
MLLAKLINIPSGMLGIPGGIKGFIRRNNIDHMMDHPHPFLGSRFGGADIHVFIDLHGIGADDLTFETLRQIDGDRRLADSGRAADNDDLGFCSRRMHRSLND